MDNFCIVKQDEVNPELDLRKQLNEKCDYITELENTLQSYELALKENKNEIEIYETQLRNKNDIILTYENNFVNVEDLRSLQQEIEEKSTLINQLQNKLHQTENELQTQKSIEELQELVGVAEVKDQRIADLEEALQESMKIAAEREMVLQQEECKRKQIVEKVYILCYCLLED